MVSQKVKIKNPTGLHLRPAGILCKEAMPVSYTHLDVYKRQVYSMPGGFQDCG